MAFSVSSNFFRNFSISINWSVSFVKSFEVNGWVCCCFREEDRFVAAVWADKLALYKSLPRKVCWCGTISAEGFCRLVPRNLLFSWLICFFFLFSYVLLFINLNCGASFFLLFIFTLQHQYKNS